MSKSTIKKRGLGRGLDALFQDEEATTFEKPAVKLPENIQQSQKVMNITDLQAGLFQPRKRFTEDALEQLADSIAAHGILQPILVRPIKGGKFEIIAGERRWRAAQQAQLHEVPVIIQDMTDQEALEIGLIENLQRKDLTPLEESEGYERLMREFSHTQENLAQQLGKSRSHIANMLRLLKLPEPVKELVQEEQLSSGHARALVTAEDPETLAAEIIKKGLSVRQAEKLAKSKKTGAKSSKSMVKKEKDVDVIALETQLSNQLGMKVSIEGQGTKGQLVINYSDLDQLDMVLEKLTA